MKLTMRFLINFASRSRPDNFFRGVESIKSNFSDESTYKIVGCFDEDDETMNNELIRERLDKTKNLTYFFGVSNSKISAINREIPNFGDDWDILINFSDDMIFIKKFFDELIVSAFDNDLDRYLHFRDTNHRTPDALCTLHIVGRDYFERDGFIYHPNFESVFCDNFNDNLAKARKKYYFYPDVIFKHLHPAFKLAEKDEQYERTENKAVWARDKATYNKMKKELHKYV